MIRSMEARDIQAIVELGKRVVPNPNEVFLSWDAMPSILFGMIENPDLFALVVDNDGVIDGAVIAGITAYPWDYAQLVCMVALLWSGVPGHGKMLMGEVSRWARAMGATLMLAGSRTDRASHLYSAMRMKPVETNYMGRL
jgi:hypothetical protein